MILLFPNADTFHLVLTGGFVPSDIVLSPATFSHSRDHELSVGITGRLPKKAANELNRLGVRAVKDHLGDPVAVSTWLQILPLTRDDAPPQIGSQAAVLFELESADDLSILAGEMLRLGNDRQQLRLLTGEGGPRALLRVIGPPYYTLLRAIDQTSSGTQGRVHAYLEQAPRVWVQLGFSHPLAAKIQMPDEQLVLIREPIRWTFLPEAPFRDVYEILTFPLPEAELNWTASPVTEKLQVPLRLAAGNAADVPEMWVLRGSVGEQLDRFVRDADERLLQRLKFAVAADSEGRTVIVLRVATSKQTPPTLTLPGAIGFKPYFKLPNLYIPVGTRLHPTLRRDAVRNLLASDPDQLVWLFPNGPAFTPESLGEDSFRPLEDWVEYVVESNVAPLEAWIQATGFRFNTFICGEQPDPKPKDPDDDKKRRTPKAEPITAPPAKSGTDASGNDGDPLTPTTALDFSPSETRPPSEWKLRREELEQAFLQVDGALNDSRRLALWPELAVANAALNAPDEAALCWAYALWQPVSDWKPYADGWVRSEFPTLALPVNAETFDRSLASGDPGPTESRRFASLLYWAISQDPLPEWMTTRLPAARTYFEKCETKLPVRLVWLIASRLVTLAGKDMLGLARVRDRLLNRLLEDGLKPERDLPTFLRYDGLKDSAQKRQLREQIRELHAIVRSWVASGLVKPGTKTMVDQGATLGYTDLFFAFGLARLGEVEAAQRLTASARVVLIDSRDSQGEAGHVADFLFRALKYRIEQAIAGRPHHGPFPPELMRELAGIESKDTHSADNPFGHIFYAISRMREQFRILDPNERFHPYLKYMTTPNDTLKRSVLDLLPVRDPGVITTRFRELYKQIGRPNIEPDSGFHLLTNVLPLGARVGEEFTLEMLRHVPEVMNHTGAPIANLNEKQARLLERALAMAAHYDHREMVQQLTDQFLEQVRGMKPEARNEVVGIVTRQCLRSLRKLGLREEIDRLLVKLQQITLGGETVEAVRTRLASRPDQWTRTLSSLLNIAGGWMTFGLTEKVIPILDETRDLLLKKTPPKMSLLEYTQLTLTYLNVIGQGRGDQSGFDRMVELFTTMPEGKVTNSLSSARFFSRLHLNMVEETVLALVNDDFTIGPAGQHWLDEDEQIIRQRIHTDMRKHLTQGDL